MTTDVSQFIQELNGGVTEQQLSRAISDVARATLAHSKQGEVTLTLKFKVVGESQQVAIDHTLKTSQPKARGKIIEDNTVTTPMHVNQDDSVSLFPANQMDLLGKRSIPAGVE